MRDALNILTPSNYQEFMRVLAPEGSLVKVIPGNDYLAELRQQLYRSNPEKTNVFECGYSRASAVRISSVTFEEVRYTVKLTDATYRHLLEMTPLYWGATQKTNPIYNEHPLSTVTVHYIIAVVKSRKE